MSESATSATATSRSARLPVLKNSRRADLAVAVAEVAVSDTALVSVIKCFLKLLKDHQLNSKLNCDFWSLSDFIVAVNILFP